MVVREGVTFVCVHVYVCVYASTVCVMSVCWCLAASMFVRLQSSVLIP